MDPNGSKLCLALSEVQQTYIYIFRKIFRIKFLELLNILVVSYRDGQRFCGWTATGTARKKFPTARTEPQNSLPHARNRNFRGSIITARTQIPKSEILIFII